MSTYFTVYNGNGYDESLHYPLFNCDVIKNFIKSGQTAASISLDHLGSIMVEKDWDRPKWYRNIETRTDWIYNGTKWTPKK